MMHSQLPVPSLFCALLMLPLGMSEGLSDVPLTDAGVKKARAFAVQQYNKDLDDVPNYFKLVCLVKAQLQEGPQLEYHFTIVLAKTVCEKQTGMAKSYKRIQKCRILPENLQITCYFQVTSSHQLNNLHLDIAICV